METPEKAFVRKESGFIGRAHEWARSFLDEHTPSPGDFRGIHGFNDAKIDKDLAYVQKREEEFASRGKGEEQMLSTILEAIIHEQAELSEWLGSRAYTIKASRFDDIANGVDSIVEFDEKEGPQHLALAMDVTFSSAVENKLRRIKMTDIEEGQLPTIEYFESEVTGERKRLPDVPRVVIGVDRRTMDEIMELRVSGNKKALAKHRIQHMILREIELQLEAFADYADRLGKTDIAKRYREDLQIIKGVIKEKKSEAAEQYTQDRVFDAIRTYTRFSFR